MALPIITYCYVIASVITTVACHLEIISPNDLYLSPTLVLKEFQYWRLVTNFLYLGNDFEFVFHTLLLAQYLKLIKETSFGDKTSDVVYMLLYGATVLTVNVFIGKMIPYVADSFVEIRFLSNSLIFMLVYVWSKQYLVLQVSVLGFLIIIPAANLPWLFLGLSNQLGGNGYADLLGMVAGHAYYYFDEL